MDTAYDGPGIIHTVSGNKLSLIDPCPSKIRMRDFVTGMSMIPRFAGQAKAHINVLQHSILVALLCPEGEEYHGLMHDTPEGYIGDVSKPFKVMPEMAGYCTVEKRLTEVMAQIYGFPSQKTPAVAYADAAAVRYEAWQWKEHPPSWACDLTPRQKQRVPDLILTTAVSQQQSIDLFYSYYGTFKHQARDPWVNS